MQENLQQRSMTYVGYEWSARERTVMLHHVCVDVQMALLSHPTSPHPTPHPPPNVKWQQSWASQMPGTINIPTLVEPELIKIILCSMWVGVSQLGQYISLCVRENATVGWTTWLFPVLIRFKYPIYRKFLVSSISRRLDRIVYIWILPLYVGYCWLRHFCSPH